MQAHKLIQSRAGARVDPYFSKDTQVAHGRTRVAHMGGLGQYLSGSTIENVPLCIASACFEFADFIFSKIIARLVV